MEIAVAGSVAVDVATKDDLAEHHRRLKDVFPKPPRGRYYTVDGSGQTASGFTGSGPIAIGFTPASPPAGRMWFLQWIAMVVATLDINATVANVKGALMVGRSPVGGGGSIGTAPIKDVSYRDIVVPGNAIPASVTIPDKTVVKSQNEMYMLLSGSGLAASTTYVAVVGVIDVPDDDEAYFW